jgi:hypothetical protein
MARLCCHGILYLIRTGNHTADGSINLFVEEMKRHQPIDSGMSMKPLAAVKGVGLSRDSKPFAAVEGVELRRDSEPLAAMKAVELRKDSEPLDPC